MGLEGNLRPTERLNLSVVCGGAALTSGSLDVGAPNPHFLAQIVLRRSSSQQIHPCLQSIRAIELFLCHIMRPQITRKNHPREVGFGLLAFLLIISG